MSRFSKLMAGMALGISTLFGLAVCSGDELVFHGGTRLQIESATVRGSTVVVTHADGRTVAYAIDEVDLEASGLMDEAATRAEPSPAPTPGLLSLADAYTKSVETGGMRITDDDVAHIETDEESDEVSDAPGVKVEIKDCPGIKVSGVRLGLDGTTLKVVGAVTNATPTPVSEISLAALALGTAKVEVGYGTATVSKKVTPGMALRFEIQIEISGAPEMVEVRVVGGIGPAGLNPCQSREADKPSATPKPDEKRPNMPPRPRGARG